MSVRGYTLAGDWSGHGNYAETQEDLTSRVQKGDLSIVMGRDSDSTTGVVASGELSAALNNTDRVLSPENTTGPLYGKIRPGIKVRFTATAGTSIYNLFEGVQDDYDVAGDPQRTFTLKALDAWGRPGAEKLSTPLYTGIRTGAAIALILDAIGWTGPRELDPGATNMPYWWVEGDDAASAVQKLIEAEGPPSIAYVRGGTFVFRDRHHRMFRANSLTSQGTYTHIEPAGSGPVGDLKIERDSFVYDHGLRAISNSVAFDVPVRAFAEADEVWSSDEQLSLIAGEVRFIQAAASDPFRFADVSLDVASGVVTAALDRDSGASVNITVTATTAAVVTRLAVVAQAAPEVRSLKASAQDSSSIGTYTLSTWDGEDPPYANVYDAQAIANRIIAVYASNRPRVTFTVACVNTNTAYMSKLLALDISDRITVRNDRHDLNADFMIERIEHVITNLRIHRVIIGAQIADTVQATNTFTFDVAGQGFNQGTFATVGIDNPATVFRFDTAGQGFNDGAFAN